MKRKSTTTRKKRVQRKGSWINKGQGYTSLSLRKPTTLSDSIFVCLDYCESFNLTSITNVSDQEFIGNSCYQPYPSGHQPLGYDQFSAFYQAYRVYASGIDVYLQSQSAAVEQFAIIPSGDSTIYGTGNVTNAVESNRSKLSIMTAQGAAAAGIKLKHYATTREILGLVKTEIEDSALAAVVTTNPVRLWYWHVVIFTPALTTVNCALTVKLRYYVQFYRRQALANS